MYSNNRGFDLMIPKTETSDKEDFKYHVSFKILNKTFTFALQVNSTKE